MPTASALETEFALWLRTEPDIPEPQTEWRFRPPRRWRFDMVWLDQKVAVEIDGITHYGNWHWPSPKRKRIRCRLREIRSPHCWTVGAFIASPAPGSEMATIPSGDRKLWTR